MAKSNTPNLDPVIETKKAKTVKTKKKPATAIEPQTKPSAEEMKQRNDEFSYEMTKLMVDTEEAKLRNEKKASYFLRHARPRTFNQRGLASKIHTQTIEEKMLLERRNRKEYSDDLAFLSSSVKNGATITGVVSGKIYNTINVEEDEIDENGNPIKVTKQKRVYAAKVKFKGPSGTEYYAIIPYEDFILKDSKNVHLNESAYLSRRINSTVDFVLVPTYDENGKMYDLEHHLNTKQFKANRKIASALKRKEIWFAKNKVSWDKEEDYMYPGKICTARVVSVAKEALVVEIDGVEAVIPIREVTWLKCADLKMKYMAGNNILVMLTKVEKEIVEKENGEKDYKVYMECSAKATKKNPAVEACRCHSVGEEAHGTVVYVGGDYLDTIYFIVELDEITQVKCLYNGKNNEYAPKLYDSVSIEITSIDYEELKLKGKVIHRNMIINRTPNF